MSIVTIGQKIRDARHARGKSLAVVASTAGCSIIAVSEIERGIANPTIGLLQRVAGAVGLEIAPRRSRG